MREEILSLNTLPFIHSHSDQIMTSATHPDNPISHEFLDAWQENQQTWLTHGDQLWKEGHGTHTC
jgi:hypothetical protein